jgi:hypothetical protein
VVRVDLVARFVTALDAVDTARRRLESQRTGLSRPLCRQILDWPVLSEGDAKIFEGELAQGGPLRVVRARQLITQSMDQALQQSQARVVLAWHKQHRPELALVTETTTGLYLADALAHLGVMDGDRTTACRNCGQPFTPKRRLLDSETPYCRRPECQRARWRAKQATYRARQRTTEPS